MSGCTGTFDEARHVKTEAEIRELLALFEYDVAHHKRVLANPDLTSADSQNAECGYVGCKYAVGLLREILEQPNPHFTKLLLTMRQRQGQRN